MFRSRNFLIFCGLAIVVALPCSLVAQDEPAAGGFKLKPSVVVEEEMDEGALIDKVSLFLGYNMMKNLSREKKIDKEMLFKGMKAAVEGPDQESYVLGYEVMKKMEEQDAGLKLEKMFEGINSASEGKELDMSQEQIRSMMNSFGKLVQKRAEAKVRMAIDENTAATEAYMAKNAENPDVKELPNGVQYEVLVAGTGASPTKEDRVKVNYHGTLVDGTVFDSTIKLPNGQPGKPVEFPVGGVVEGFSSALQAMKVGGKWRVVIPGELAYGVEGRGGKIGPNQALIFEIGLLEILEKSPGPK